MSSVQSIDGTDRKAFFVELVLHNEQQLYGYILSMVPTWTDADEIFQETNLRLWEQFDRFELGTDFLAWACTVAYYQVQTFRKRKGRQKVHFSQDFVDAAAEEATHMQQTECDREDALLTCLNRLHPNSREMVKLSYTSGLSMQQVADKFRRTVASTYKALSRIRLALHQCIENQLASSSSLE